MDYIMGTKQLQVEEQKQDNFLEQELMARDSQITEV